MPNYTNRPNREVTWVDGQPVVWRHVITVGDDGQPQHEKWSDRHRDVEMLGVGVGARRIVSRGYTAEEAWDSYYAHRHMVESRRRARPVMEALGEGEIVPHALMRTVDSAVWAEIRDQVCEVDSEGYRFHFEERPMYEVAAAYGAFVGDYGAWLDLSPADRVGRLRHANPGWPVRGRPSGHYTEEADHA